MKFKKIIAISMACLAMVAVVAGCGNNKKDDVVIMGTNAAFPPFEYVVEKGLVDNYDGVDIAISLEIANALGKKLQIDNMDFSSVLAAVPTGSVDFAAAGMTADDKRRESMDFSIPYYTASQYMIVKKDNNDINSSKDILDKAVGVVQGYTGEEICIETLEIPNLMAFKTGMEAVADLKQGRIDVVVIDSHTATAMVSLNNDLKIIEDPEVFESEQYAIAVKKGNKELLDKINNVLDGLIKSGKIDEFVDKYSKETME